MSEFARERDNRAVWMIVAVVAIVAIVALVFVFTQNNRATQAAIPADVAPATPVIIAPAPAPAPADEPAR